MGEPEATMFSAIAEFVSTQQGDSVEFIEKAQAIAIGIAQDFLPTRLYAVRIDNWFGPRWMHFAGTAIVGKVGRFPAIGVGLHKAILHVPPFVPHRVVEERVFVGPAFEEMVVAAPLHIECPSKQALSRRIADIDKEAAFLWFSGDSEAQGRGSVMVYLPVAIDAKPHRRRGLHDYGSFFVGFSQRNGHWEPAMLRGVSRTEVTHLEASGRALIDNEQLARIPCV